MFLTSKFVIFQATALRSINKKRLIEANPFLNISYRSNWTGLRKNIKTNNNDVNKFSIIFRSFGFTTLFGVSAYTLSTIFQYEKEIRRKLPEKFSSKKFPSQRTQLNEIWNSFSNLTKAAFGIIFINGLIFFATHSLRTAPFISKYFVLSSHSKIQSQMLLATFNHGGLLHLSFNMFCLYTLSNYLTVLFPAEQFLAFYLSAGVFASFISRSCNLLLSRPSFSLGASGAVLSCFTLVSLFFPEHQFYIFPIPVPIESQMMLKGLVLIDLCCLIAGFKRIDHACHLGGILYSYLLVTYGQSYLKNWQNTVVKNWKEIRKFLN